MNSSKSAIFDFFENCGVNLLKSKRKKCSNSVFEHRHHKIKTQRTRFTFVKTNCMSEGWEIATSTFDIFWFIVDCRVFLRVNFFPPLTPNFLSKFSKFSKFATRISKIAKILRLSRNFIFRVYLFFALLRPRSRFPVCSWDPRTNNNFEFVFPPLSIQRIWDSSIN